MKKLARYIFWAFTMGYTCRTCMLVGEKIADDERMTEALHDRGFRWVWYVIFGLAGPAYGLAFIADTVADVTEWLLRKLNVKGS